MREVEGAGGGKGGGGRENNREEGMRKSLQGG